MPLGQGPRMRSSYRSPNGDRKPFRVTDFSSAAWERRRNRTLPGSGLLCIVRWIALPRFIRPGAEGGTTMEDPSGKISELHVGIQILLIAGVTVGLHGMVYLIRGVIERRAAARFGSIAKARTISSLFNSTLIFFIYFTGLGTALTTLGVDIKAFVAGASIIGLAVAFGSQGFVQDVVTGVTVIFSDLFDVGELVDISGKSGIVKSIGMRFTVLASSHGAEIFIPNRTITSVTNYPKGYLSLMVDFRASEDEALTPVMVERARKLMRGAYEQFPVFFWANPKSRVRLSRFPAPFITASSSASGPARALRSRKRSVTNWRRIFARLTTRTNPG